MIASGLLNFRHSCALRLEGKSQVGNFLMYVSAEGRSITSCWITLLIIFPIVAQLPTFALAGKHPVHLVGSLS